MVVLLASYPRSGNTWFRVLAHALYGIKTADCYNPEGKFSEEEGQRDVELLVGQSSVAEVEKGTGVGLLKTHEMADGADSRPAICLVRDGRDVYVSYAHFATTFLPNPTGVDFQAHLRAMVESPDYFGGWSRNVESWLTRKSPTVFVRYEEMLGDPEKSLRESLETLGLTFGSAGQKPLAFEELKQLLPNFFRRGKAGSWRDEMPPEVEDLFWTHHGATMERLGYPR
jgi:hypothetical protein